MICKIRKWEFSDAADLAAVLSNKKIQNNLRDGLPYPYTEQAGIDFISDMLSADENETFAFAITVDNIVIGSIGVFRQSNIHRQTAELGYYIAERYWGKGITTEAIKQICKYVFSKSDIIRIYAEPFAYNTASCRVLEKAGFQFEGTLRNNAVKNGKVIDMKMYSLLKEERSFSPYSLIDSKRYREGKKEMDNPWKSIKLSDYESHMKLDTVMQLQTLNRMMKIQLNSYPVQSVTILGIAGGNGLEHINPNKYSVVYGVDVNQKYLQEVQIRYENLDGLLKCLCLDLIMETSKLPVSDLIIANLLIEYIGYENFQNAVMQAKPQYVSCGIQINSDDDFVSDSPYLHTFDGLSTVHHDIEIKKLSESMGRIGYECILKKSYTLPNGKELAQLDFKYQE